MLLSLRFLSKVISSTSSFSSNKRKNLCLILAQQPEQGIVTLCLLGSLTFFAKLNSFKRIILFLRLKELSFAKKVPPLSELKKYKFVFIDSINHARITIEQYQQMHEEAPETAFILVLQQTKSGVYKGGTDWPHEVEITMSLRKNEFGERVLNITKDRYTEPVPRQITI